MYNLGFLMVLLPYLRAGMGSGKTIISFIAGGFLSSNGSCAVEHFRNPIVRLDIVELELKFDSTAQQQTQKSNKKWMSQIFEDWKNAHDKILECKRQAGKRMNKEQNPDMHNVKAEYDKARQ